MMHVAIKKTRMRLIAFGPAKGVFIGEYLRFIYAILSCRVKRKRFELRRLNLLLHLHVLSRIAWTKEISSRNKKRARARVSAGSKMLPD